VLLQPHRRRGIPIITRTIGFKYNINLSDYFRLVNLMAVFRNNVYKDGLDGGG
jgi:hypothetical protein